MQQNIFFIIKILNYDITFTFTQNDGRAYSFCGTIEYMAPEIVKGGQKGHGMVSIFTLLLFYIHSFYIL